MRLPFLRQQRDRRLRLLTDDANRVLLIRRGRNPGKGKWSVPGGFVDAGESAETALARELREEVGLELASLTYLCSHPNPYEYKGVVFPVVDLIFICQARSLEPLKTLRASDEVDGYAFLHVEEVDLDEVAFPSIRVGLERFRQSQEPNLSL